VPRLVALKHPEWTGKAVWVWDDKNPEKSCRVVILGTDIRGSALVGRQKNSKILWNFLGVSYPHKLGLPLWCAVLRVCAKCKHEECTFCRYQGNPGFGWCDVVDEDGGICCDGECTYEESPP